MGANNQQPKYRHHRSTNQAFLEIAKRRIYLGVYGTEESYERYWQQIEAWAAKQRPSRRPKTRKAPVVDLTVVELLDRYWDYAQERYQRLDPYAVGRSETSDANEADADKSAGARIPTRTLDNIKPALKRVRERFGEIRACDFDYAQLEQLTDEWLDELSPHTGRRLSRKTINDYLANVKRVFKWAARKARLVPAQTWANLDVFPPLERGRTRARERKRIPPVADAIVDATLPHLPPTIADMVRLQRLTGARPGEIRMMRPCDVQRWTRPLKPPPLFVAAETPERQVDVWEYRPASHKTEHHDLDRVIFLGPKAQAILEPYLLALTFKPESFCFSPKRSESARNATRRQRTGKTSNERARCRPDLRDYYGKDEYAKAIARACEMAFEMPAELRRVDRKLPAEERERLKREARAWRRKHLWKPNQLRHTAATELRKRYGLESTRCVLGHTTADTSEIYAERDLAAAAQIAREVG